METKKNVCYTFLLLFFSLLFGFGSCGKSSSESDSLAVVDTLAPAYYRLLISGRYADYVNAMESVYDKPQFYRVSILLAVKQHMAAVKKEKGGIISVKFLRKEVYDEGNMVKAYLRIAFANNTEEEVVMPLVKDGENWKMQ